MMITAKSTLRVPALFSLKSKLMGTIWDFAHFGFVCYLSSNLKSLGFFFTLSLSLCLLKQSISERQRVAFQIGSVFLLTAVLFRLRAATYFDVSTSLSGFGLLVNKFATVDLRTLGISYCYLRSVYAITTRQSWTILSFFRYFFFAPTFMSGPIMTPEDFELPRAIHSRAWNQDTAYRLAIGSLKLIAASLVLTSIPLVYAKTFLIIPNGSTYPDQFLYYLAGWPLALLWVGVFFSGLWLFLNFSGFSDLYIGASMLFGIKPPENFDRPFRSRSITEFWQRWHMSLGVWLRTQCFKPIAILGNGVWATRLIAPLLTMLVCGAWHGATTSFLTWGAMHGVGLSAHAAWSSLVRVHLPETVTSHLAYRLFSWIITHSWIAMSWVFFLPLDNQIGLFTRLHIAALLVGIKP